MRYSREHTEETRQRILEAAGREFREHGFGGVGVDGLAHAAGVTSGAFYRHFRSKAEAFRAVVAAGVKRLRLGVEHYRRLHGQKWVKPFATYYLSQAHRRDVAGGCALPSLSAEVEHASDATRADYETELQILASEVARGLSNSEDRQAAWALLAQLAGGVLLARAVKDELLANEIAQAVLVSALAPHGETESSGVTSKTDPGPATR
ncbi:MAG: TetR/AcrR family transcriptional regulator [Burkholderiaceae bacterium]|jgi:AcrR family transcriptional regulator